jgi:hypothetical protein
MEEENRKTQVKEGESSSNNVDEPIGRRFDDDKGI